MHSNKNMSEVQNKYETFLKLSAEAAELHKSMNPLLPEGEMSKQNEWFETRMHSNKEIIQKNGRVVA